MDISVTNKDLSYLHDTQTAAIALSRDSYTRENKICTYGKSIMFYLRQFLLTASIIHICGSIISSLYNHTSIHTK